ncbi:MAG: CtsR family transcriptional regulator [Clostridia bacterium]|nr:CtsR family transcriptional regulator [Clostridia bacterium]
MSTLANQIEVYLKKLLSATESGVLELKRSDLAEIFMCVPSQINYVLSTRFSSSQGYLVESRRGGGGYLRIIRLSIDNEPNLTALLENGGERRVSRQAGEKLIDRLLEEEFLSKREGMIIKAMIDDRVIGSAANADGLRCDLINAVLLLLLRDDFSE